VHGSTTLYKTPIPSVKEVAAAAKATVDITGDSNTNSMDVDSGSGAAQQQQQRGIAPVAVLQLRTMYDVRAMYELLHQRCVQRAATLQARIAAAPAHDTAAADTADTTASTAATDSASSSSDAVEGGLAAAGQQVAAEQMKAKEWIGDLPTKLRANAAPRFTHEEDNVLLGTLTRVIDTVYEKPVSVHIILIMSTHFTLITAVETHYRRELLWCQQLHCSMFPLQLDSTIFTCGCSVSGLQ
jgi:hypothetical protein